MNKKIILILLLSAGIAVFSFGETYVGTSVGFYHLGDRFFDEDYGRNMNGPNFILSYHYFPANSSLGVFTRISIGSFSQGLEWKGDTEISKIDYRSAWDLRLCVAPSYKFRLSERVQIPVSLGPILSLYSEETSDYYFWDETANGTLYYAMNLGLLADGAIVISPAKKYFFIISGISLGCDFLHPEKGEMHTNYREFRGTRYKVTPYMGYNLSVYLGVGVNFDFD